MNTEEQLQRSTEWLLLVRDNLMRGMSKSIQKLQARGINEFLHLPSYMQSHEQPVAWLTRDSIDGLWYPTSIKRSDTDKPLYTNEYI